MVISLKKTILKESDLGAYSIAGGGSGTTACTLTLNGVTGITISSKKNVIDILIPESGDTQTTNPSDKYNTKILDLKRGTDDIKIRCWLEDTAANDSSVDVGGSPESSAVSAWEKAWILKAMCAQGGALTNLTIDNIQLTPSTQEAHLEEVTITANPTGTKTALGTSLGDDRARIELELTFLLGDDRNNE